MTMTTMLNDQIGSRHMVGTDDRTTDVMVIVPHPDDEVIYFGGLLNEASLRGLACHVVIVTHGANGCNLDQLGRRDLIRRRKAESQVALKSLGVARTQCLDFDDFNLTTGDEGNWTQLKETLERILEREKPQVIITLPPNGVNGHPDHIRLSDQVLSAANLHGIPVVYFTSREDPHVDRAHFLKREVRCRIQLQPTHSIETGKEKIRALGIFVSQALAVLGVMRRLPELLVTELYWVSVSNWKLFETLFPNSKRLR